MHKTKLTTFLAIISFALFGVAGVASAAVNECDNWQTNHPEWLFCDDFEAGSFRSGWNLIWNTTDVNLVPAPTDSAIIAIPPTGTNNVSKIHYYIASSTPAHQDHNRFLEYVLSTALDHIFIRGYVLIPKNTVLYGATRSIQRKLIYFKSNNWASPSSGFGFMLTSDANSPTDDYVTLRLGYGGVGGTVASIWNMGQIKAGVWIAVEAEVVLNQIGASNGVFRLWINDSLAYEATNLDYRSPYGNNSLYKIGSIEVGRQVDRLNGDLVDEYRYWDDIVISTARIYSLVSPDTTPPSAPTGLVVN